MLPRCPVDDELPGLLNIDDIGRGLGIDIRDGDNEGDVDDDGRIIGDVDDDDAVVGFIGISEFGEELLLPLEPLPF